MSPYKPAAPANNRPRKHPRSWADITALLSSLIASTVSSLDAKPQIAADYRK